jgi:RNA recognition motif-containing protein
MPEIHNILFVNNLPRAVNKEVLHDIFGDFPGFKEIRTNPYRDTDVAFVEYETPMQAASAKNGVIHQLK